MKIFDSHCHLDDGSFKPDLDAVIARARDAGVVRMMVAGINLQSAQQAIALAETIPGVVASVGVHPHDASSCSDAVLKALGELARHPKVRAWGETGLDFNRMFSPRDIQETWFARQLDLAVTLDLPLIFHERDSQGRFGEILAARCGEQCKGVVHCFSGTRRELIRYLDMGLHIGITGILTVKTRGADLRELVELIPADRLLVETDAPYLIPTPERNKYRRNEPAFVRTVLLKLADVRGDDPNQLAGQIWDNTCRLFGIAEED
jgi:TatD DNase family protein